MKAKILLMITASVLMLFGSCKKESLTIEQSSINLADDEALADAVFEDVFSSVDNATLALDEAMKSGDSKSGTLAVEDGCPVVTVEHPSDGIWPKVITIDYGTGCTGFNNNTRSGKIIVDVTGPRRLEGSKRTVTFDEYYFNGMKVEGIKVFENLGLNGNQNFVIRTTLTEGKLILPDGKTIEREASHEKEWITGFLTPGIWDDECLITGTASGVNADGTPYVRTIISALHWKRVCAFIVSGTIKIETDGADPFELDYGQGECDNKAVVTRNGESKEIELRHHHRKWTVNR